MKKAFKPLLLAALLGAVGLASCDDGDIQESSVTVQSSGKTVKLTGTFTGLDTWKEYNYNVVLASFSDDSDYASSQVVISSSIMGNDSTGTGVTKSVTLTNIASDVDYVELAITNSLRTRIITLESIALDDYDDYGPEDTIYMDMGDVDLTLLGVMQSGVFDKACIACHGANGSSAGNTNLTEGNAYASLVDVASTQKDGYCRVVSGDPESSLLWIILNEGGENVLHYNHTEVLSSTFKNNLTYVKELIYDWIASLK